jgi:hypothetical protein
MQILKRQARTNKTADPTGGLEDQVMIISVG